MANTDSFTVAFYDFDGIHQKTLTTQTADLDSSVIHVFKDKFKLLSGDLELPYEDKLTGDCESIRFRIGSDLNGAYVLYYLDDEVILASLYLSGTDEELETELMQVFKYLLLDTEDDDEPTEEEIEAVLASELFEFESVVERPVVYQVEVAPSSDYAAEFSNVRRADLALATAFFELERETDQ